jgi:3-oxoacyl-[acyl-carrier-protein] synthase III
LAHESVLEIIAYGAWNGGKLVDNSEYENKGMFFKGQKPVNNDTIEERIGVRTRRTALPGERIGVISMQDLINSTDIDLSKIKIIIEATNVGEDKYDPGPLVQKPFELIRSYCPDALALDLYAGCPGFNVAAEVLFTMSLAGMLKRGDLSVVVGAENIHRAKAFRPLDTSNIIFGDDSLATAFETKATCQPQGSYLQSDTAAIDSQDDFITAIAEKIFTLNGRKPIDGLIIDNQLGKLEYRVPATAARVQHRWVELMYPEEVSSGTFDLFKDAIRFYEQHVNSFAYDIMTMDRNPEIVQHIARAYVESGKAETVVSVYLAADRSAVVAIHQGQNYTFIPPRHGIVDTLTRTQGCFAGHIEALPNGDDVFGEIDGKGVFQHATRSAGAHFAELLAPHHLTLQEIDLLIEHQANFSMIPLTLARVIPTDTETAKEAVENYIANKMIMNIHDRGNCSVVCMQRLPYDLERDALKEDVIQGFAVNRNLSNLKNAKVILNDSVGSGMTRSSFMQKKA